MRRLVVLGVLVTAAALAAPARAAATQVTLDGQAGLDAGQVQVGFTATCTGGSGTVTVRLTQGAVRGTGSTLAACDGQPHTGAVTVVGAFQLGAATARATLASPGGSDTDSRQIQIVA
jgi:hypothetical protein